MPLIHLAAVSVPLSVTDAREHRLPNTFVVPGLVLLLWATVGAGVHDPDRALAVLAIATVGAAVFGAGWAAGAVGMGDLKLAVLLAGTAGLTDPLTLAPIAFAAALLATATAATTVPAAVAPQWRRRGGHPRIPLGPPLLTGFWVGFGLAL